MILGHPHSLVSWTHTYYNIISGHMTTHIWQTDFWSQDHIYIMATSFFFNYFQSLKNMVFFFYLYHTIWLWVWTNNYGHVKCLSILSVVIPNTSCDQTNLYWAFIVAYLLWDNHCPAGLLKEFHSYFRGHSCARNLFYPLTI